MPEAVARASVRYAEPNTLAVDAASETDASVPGPTEVIVAPAYVGVCGTDLHIYQGHMGDRVAPGTVLGHESSAVITAVGDEVAHHWQVGDHVCVFPVVWCGTCRTCLGGRGHVCPNLRILGIDDDGAMQSAWRVPADHLVRLPATLSLQTAALVEPLAVAVHDVCRGRVGSGERALVVGAGPVGMLIALVARERGADVTLVEPNQSRRGVAAELGFRVLAPDAVATITPPDVAFEVTGVGPGLELAVRSLTPGGRLVAVGIHPEPRVIDFQLIFLREIEILGARLYGPGDFTEAVNLLTSGRIDPVPLVSDVLPLTEAGTAFDLLLGGAAMKILLEVGPTD